MEDISQLLSDDTRYKIFQETINKGEMTTSDYLERIDISRSTLSHHLTKMVQASLLQVRIATTGHSQKFWSINSKIFAFRHHLVIDPEIGEDQLSNIYNDQINNQKLQLTFLQVQTIEFDKLSKKCSIGFDSDPFQFILDDKEKKYKYNPLKLEFTSEKIYNDFMTELSELQKRYFLKEISTKGKSTSETSSINHVIYFGGFALPKPIKIQKKIKKF